MRLSLIIAAHNEGPALWKTVASCVETCAGLDYEIVVADDGPGIGPELRDRIFEPFFTTRGLGTGLGLPIALGVARAHGGSIELRSQPGAGAEFIVHLPVAPPETASP